ncbi:hypothetical protein KCMC57_up56250 [Kitasatospora sp. CMC57]|uniref:Uncharacterized protein n=1 Tax=Kitasatospora sp. CMC57 TaxID=3231513 RepID=A0AB33K6E7_9ACTN
MLVNDLPTNVRTASPLMMRDEAVLRREGTFLVAPSQRDKEQVGRRRPDESGQLSLSWGHGGDIAVKKASERQ